MILLLGDCGLERLADALRGRAEVVLGAWNQVELAALAPPTLLYVDLLNGLRQTPDLEQISAVIHALRDTPVVYRLPRLGSPVGAGLWPEYRENPLLSLLNGQRVLDVAALWAWHGIVADEVLVGPTHGEARLDATGISRLNGKTAIEVEAEALWSLFQSRVQKPVKCIVVDLDDTLIHGLVTDESFAQRNPAWQPEEEEEGGDLEAGWWCLKRGLHHALREMQRRGMVLALATRNDPEVVRRRWRKRPVKPGVELSEALQALALGPDDFVVTVAGFQEKSAMCREIAERLGIGSDSLLFLDDSPFEREEVKAHLPEVRVMEGPVEGFRQELLHGPWCTVWEKTVEAGLRAGSYRSRAAVTAVEPERLQDFLIGLQIRVLVRKALPAEKGRVEELLRRSHQLNLNGRQPDVDGATIWVAFCEDRLADHGLVAAGIFGEDPPELLAWVCSCRVLPHRVAGSILWAMRQENQGSTAEWVATGRNGASRALLAETGLRPWVQLTRIP